MYTKDELKELMSHAKDLGVNAVKVDGFEVQFGQAPQAPAQSVKSTGPVPEVKVEDIFKALPTDDPINDEELMRYYATPYYDVLIAEREAKQKAINESLTTREPVKDGTNG
jgi:hypothetical protein